MLIIGCDYHPSYQQIAVLDTAGGERVEGKLSHKAEAEAFYRGLSGRVRVGMEASGHSQWFEALLAELGHELWIGDPAKIRALEVRKQKTDARDSRHLLELLEDGRFPRLWVPDAQNRDLRQLIVHRHRLVQMRTRVKNQLQYLALNQGLRRQRGLWTQQGRQQLEALPLSPWAARRRQELLALLEQLNRSISDLDQAVAREAAARPEVRRLMTHPGVGPVIGLAFYLTLGPCQRFPRGRNVASYFGLIPTEHSSGGKQRLGHISKQGNALLRCLLVEGAQTAVRSDAELGRFYRRLAVRKSRALAKVAVARRLAIRLYWMLRNGCDYAQLVRAHMQGSPRHPVVEVRTDRLNGHPASLAG